MNRKPSLPLILKNNSQTPRSTKKFIAVDPADPCLLSPTLSKECLSATSRTNGSTNFDFLMSNKKDRKSSLIKYRGSTGQEAKIEFFQTYKELHRYTERQQLKTPNDNPNVAYLQEIYTKSLCPQPFGIVKRKGEPGSIDVKKMGMGDSYAIALSHSLKHLSVVTKLNLNSNRLTERGTSSILNTLKVENLQELNLSDNRIGSGSVDRIIDMLTDRKCEIKKLNIEKTYLSITDVKRICEELEMNTTLTRINLAKNGICGPAAQAVANLLSCNSTVKYLDLHWNNIRGPESVSIFKALASNRTIKVLDMSWNSMGNNYTLELASAVSEAFSANKRLAHFDISYNYFNIKECKIIGKGLKNNHSLYGLHILGNDCAIDSRGFIVPRYISDVHFTNQPIEFRRIIEELPYLNKGLNSNCWLCDTWVEYTFYWRSGVSGGAESDPIFIHLDIDEYHPEMMKKGNHGVFSITRALPQREIKFFYSHIEGKNIKPMLNKQIKVRKLDDKLTVNVKFWDGKIEDIHVMSLNSILPKGQICLMKMPFHTLPRQPVNNYTPPEKEPERIIWSIPNSLFKDYKLDKQVIYIQSHLDKCFEFDWNEGKIPNLVKNPEDQNAVKELLRVNYPHM